MKKYFDIHVRYSRKQGYSLFFEAELEKGWNKDDVISAAVNAGKLDVEDMEYVDNVSEIDKKQYGKVKVK